MMHPRVVCHQFFDAYKVVVIDPSLHSCRNRCGRGVLDADSSQNRGSRSRSEYTIMDLNDNVSQGIFLIVDALKPPYRSPQRV